jgi:hypothetical protein
MKCNETQGKWSKNKHGASKIIDTFETYQPSAPGENYSLLIMGDSNVDGDGGEVDGDGGGGDGVDGDGSEGTSPSRQGARTETYVPRISSVAATELRDFFWRELIGGRAVS